MYQMHQFSVITISPEKRTPSIQAAPPLNRDKTNPSTFQPFNLSTLQPFNHSTTIRPRHRHLTRLPTRCVSEDPEPCRAVLIPAPPANPLA